MGLLLLLGLRLDYFRSRSYLFFCHLVLWRFFCLFTKHIHANLKINHITTVLLSLYIIFIFVIISIFNILLLFLAWVFTLLLFFYYGVVNAWTFWHLLCVALFIKIYFLLLRLLSFGVLLEICQNFVKALLHVAQLIFAFTRLWLFLLFNRCGCGFFLYFILVLLRYVRWTLEELFQLLYFFAKVLDWTFFILFQYQLFINMGLLLVRLLLTVLWVVWIEEIWFGKQVRCWLFILFFTFI